MQKQQVNLTGTYATDRRTACDDTAAVGWLPLRLYGPLFTFCFRSHFGFPREAVWAARQPARIEAICTGSER